MTLNERLFDAGLMETFDAAALAKNRAELMRLLAEVDVEDAATTVETILQNRGRYS